MDSEEPISAYEFVRRLRKWHPNDFVETLLNYTRGAETDFLELKAGIEVREQDLNKGEVPEDIFWNIAHAIIGMINSRGGVLFVGVSDEKDHHVVPLESNDSKNVIGLKGLEHYVREEMTAHVLPSTGRWKYKGSIISVEDDIAQYVEPHYVEYDGHTIYAYFVRPCECDRVIVARRIKKQDGILLEDVEVCPFRERGIGKTDGKSGFTAIFNYLKKRERENRDVCPILAADAARLEEEARKQNESQDDDLALWLEDSEKSKKLIDFLHKFVQTDSILRKGSDSSAKTARPMEDGRFEAAKAPAFGLSDIEDSETRSKTEERLAGRQFDAICIKSLGSVGFLDHPDFENGIFIHVSVTNNTLLTEGQKWRVTVGTRFNAKHNAWCYCAKSAILLEKPRNRPRFSYELIADETTRRKTVGDLRGVAFEARCIVGRETCGYLNHPDFEGDIYIDVPVTDGVPIREGQIWRFEVGAHCLPPEGLWIYRARKATLVQEASPAPRHMLRDIADETSRNDMVNKLKGVVFEAVCTNGRGTCGLMSHSDFEGDIYIDIPVTNGVEIHVGQTWRFEVGAHCMGPGGPWVYRAKKAVLVGSEPKQSGVDGVRRPSNGTPAVALHDAADDGRIRRRWTLAAINDPVERQTTVDGLSGLEVDATCIKSYGTFGFLANDGFEGNIFIHASTAPNQPIVEGQRWIVAVDAVFNKKKGVWCYAAKSGRVAPSAPPATATHPATAGVPGDLGRQHYAVYVDETWPGLQDKSLASVGVIGGIAVPWDGVDSDKLPIIETHMDNGPPALRAIRTLLSVPGVFPFVLPVKLDHPATPGGDSYFELLQHALMVLFGWLLPRDGRPATIDVFLEHISGFEDGHDETEFMNVLAQAMRLVGGSRRFSELSLRCVKWVGKDFRYVPYGDLVCKTCVPHPRQQQLAAEVGLWDWDGFLPFTKEVFPALRELDTASPPGFADALVSFAAITHESPLFRRVRKMAVDRARSDPSVRDAVINRLENCYIRQDRNIPLLNRIVPAFLESFPPGAFEDRPRMQMLRILLGFQQANHNGNPESANDLTEQYFRLHPRMMALDRELCAYADLTFAVHQHDLFDFRSALSVTDKWISDPLFPALSVAGRGRLLSSRGQSLALEGRHVEADESFVRALGLFSSEAELLSDDISQTTVYRAMNMLDISLDSAVPVFESLLGMDLLSAAERPEEFFDRPFIAHLFLKTLWRSGRERIPALDAFARHLPRDVRFMDRHPGELVLLYLALLSNRTDPAYAGARAGQVELVFSRMGSEGTLGLVRCYVRAMLKRHGLATVGDEEFLKEADAVSGALPGARPFIEPLRRGWSDESVPIDCVLPFNYS